MSSLFTNLKTSTPAFILSLIIFGILISVAVLIHSLAGVSMIHLTRDPAAVIADARIYTGFLSRIGVFMWIAASTVSLFTACVVRGHRQASRANVFFLCLGFFSLLLALDDAFLLHESVFPRYLRLQEEIILGIYVAITLLWLVKFRSLILRTEYLLLLASFVAFSIAVSNDIFFKGGILFEDGAKLFGIINWLTYISRTAILTINGLPYRYK